MKLALERFDPAHVPDAAALVAERYAVMRMSIPSLPERYADPDVFASLLCKLDPRGVGIAALQGNRLAGFITAIKIDSFRGFPTWLSPEWANGAALGDSRVIYERLYTAAAERWRSGGEGAGAVGHLVLQFPFDRAAMDGWNRLGFGMVTVDGVRDLAFGPDPSRLSDGSAQDNIVIRRAASGDREAIHGLIHDLEAHLAASPIYLVRGSFSSLREVADKLADRSQAVFVACCRGRAVGYLEIGPASADASTIIRDPGTASITGAFVQPSFRGRLLGKRLLSCAVSWAREEGYERCAVDFESMNTSAFAFWSRSFSPVCVGMMRVLNP